MTQFSVVIPTLNEADNIDPLLTSLFALNLPPDSFEVIFVDDGSKDGTPEKVRAWEKKARVRLIERTEKPDLTASILAGAAQAQSDVIVVMDADLSHPTEQLSAVVAPVLNGSHDVSIGSRYIPGGRTEGWPLHRQWLSRIGGSLARPLCDVNDATSGFFAFRRELTSTISGKAHGYKILLELLMAGQGTLKVVEVPICFRDRTRGTSKLSFHHQWAYLQRLLALSGGTTIHNAGRVILIGLLCALIDIGLFQILKSNGAGLAAAHMASFLAAAAVLLVFNSSGLFRSRQTNQLQWPRIGRIAAVGSIALLSRGSILALLVDGWHAPPLWGILAATAAAAIICYLGSIFYIFPVKDNRPTIDTRWRVAAIGIVPFIIVFRLIYLGEIQLIPDEAYYWNYAQHMDLSFYDHPPMVAWLIWLGTAIAGDNEFGVRIGAFICGLITMGFLYALAKNLYDKSTAIRTTLLLAVLPCTFATGFLMTTDAPVMAAWAATLYYMERALIANRSSAWLGMGIAFGLGILSKYTLGLLGAAALLFVLVDPVARRWLFRPHPYLAALLALLLFSPVIIWNLEHHWSSIMFQSSRIRGVSDDLFSPHLMFVDLLVLLSPVGLAAAFWALWPKNQPNGSETAHRRTLFVCIFTGIPLVIFFVLSLLDSLRFHWTAPLWLAIVPTMAWMMGQKVAPRSLASRIQAYWKPNIATTIAVYALLLHYVVLGIPGIPYPSFMTRYYWRETTSEIEKIAAQVQQETGQKPLVVGMSKWSVASALSFYNQHGEPMDIRSRNMFGDSGAMYEIWHPSESPTTRPVILVGMERQHLEYDRTGNDNARLLDQPGPVQSITITREGKPLRIVYYQIAKGYLGL
ncbi:glycosyltransferase family 39 protein [Nitrosomonas sp. Is24]|uniref:glycosyltransferase family 39 protein n=1 Tax=Nitrosomonas sp. Is24 TaxID=3080533 RepID=UPI00294B953A|nr:glycosyltransferase family 39 protein [Nitrosomonas sp. Is24]MDV6341848.1 glycosyltransferase family 39 protein [Nitrosomonas sp. Is24]